jgi:hypothetical protein
MIDIKDMISFWTSFLTTTSSQLSRYTVSESRGRVEAKEFYVNPAVQIAILLSLTP